MAPKTSQGAESSISPKEPERHDRPQEDLQTPSKFKAVSDDARASAPLPLRFIEGFIEESDGQDKANHRKAVRSHARKFAHLKRKDAASDALPKNRVLRNIRPAKTKSSPGIATSSFSQGPTPNGSTSISARTSSQVGKLSPAGYFSHPEAALSKVAVPSTSRMNILPNLGPVPRSPSYIETPCCIVLGERLPYLQLEGRTWPFSNPIRAPTPTKSSWMPSSTIPPPNAGARRPCLQKSAAIPSWLIKSADYFEFKQRIIEWVNKQLAMLAGVNNDEVLGVISVLTAFEIGRGNVPECQMHLDALQRIVTLRSGLHNLSSPQTAWRLQTIDLGVALITNRKPVFASAARHQRPTKPPQFNRTIDGFQIPDSPLYGTRRLDERISGSAFCESAIAILQDMRDLTNGLPPRPKPLVELDQLSLTQAAAHSLLNLISITSTIYRAAFFSPPLPFYSPVHRTAVKQLCDCLEDTRHDATWVRYPGIYLWILMTTASAARDMPEHSFLMSFVLKVTTAAVWWGREEAMEAFTKFLEVKRRVEGVGHWDK